MTPRAPLVAQLVGSLRLLERHCRANGLPAPTELAQFVGGLVAQSGTERQPLDNFVDGGDSPLMLTYEAAGEALMLSPRTVRSQVAAGELPVVSIGKSKRIPRAALVAWVERKTAAE